MFSWQKDFIQQTDRRKLFGNYKDTGCESKTAANQLVHFSSFTTME